MIKPYTPTTLDSDVGYFELVIKVHVLDFDLLLYCICWFYLIPGLFFRIKLDVSSRKDVSSFP